MRITIIISIFCLWTFELHADSWRAPRTKRYFSEDSSYMLKVVPKFIPEKYYKWVNAKPRRKKRFTQQDTTIIPCHATLYRVIGAQDTVELWNRKLINLVAPVTVLVSNDGSRVVTLDNWHSMGYGLDVFAVYNERGDLIKRYQLDEFSVFPLNDYKFSISSIWWRCGAELLNVKRKIKLCMRTEDEQTASIFYDLETFKFEKAP